MPHRISVDSIHEDVFLLLNICYASSPLAKKHDLDVSDDSEVISYHFYFGWLKSLLSEKLIGCATRTRIILDFLKDEDPEIDLFMEDKKLCKKYKLGTLRGDDTELSVREVCNKIIHATRIYPETRNGQKKPSCERWNGWICLQGTKGKKPWHLRLNVSQFCLALEELVTFTEKNYDWYHVYKYD